MRRRKKISGAGGLRRFARTYDIAVLPAIAAASSSTSTARASAIAAIASAEASTAAWTTAASAAPLATTASTARSAAVARLVDLDATSLQIRLVERFDGLGGTLLIRHFDESESS